MRQTYKNPGLFFLMFCLVAVIGCSDYGVSASNKPSATSPAPSTSTPTTTPTTTITPTATITPTRTATPTLDPCEDDDPYNGWLYHGHCIPGVVSKEFWLSSNPGDFVGMATFYAEGVMERVARNRGLSFKGHGFKGGVALMNCGDIGDYVWIKRGTQYEFEGPFLVVDCSSREHLYFNVVINGIAVEVDWETSRRWGMNGGIEGVHVCKSRHCERGAIRLSSWFKRNVTWEEAP